MKRTYSQSFEVCTVCGDRSSGANYGAVSCTACKSFFKNTISGNLRSQYECTNGGKCVIDLKTRATCRLCRYEKCVKAGMHITAERCRNLEMLQAALDAFLSSLAMQLLEPPASPIGACRFVLRVQDAAAALSVTREHFFAALAKTPLPLSIANSVKMELANANLPHRLVLDILCRSGGKNYFDLGNNLLYGLTPQPLPHDSLRVFFTTLRPTMLRVDELKVTDREFAYLRVLSFLEPLPELGHQDRELVAYLNRHFTSKMDAEIRMSQPRGSNRLSLLTMLLRITSVFAGNFRVFLRANQAEHLFAEWAIENPGSSNGGNTQPVATAGRSMAEARAMGQLNVAAAGGPMAEAGPMGQRPAGPSTQRELCTSATASPHWST